MPAVVLKFCLHFKELKGFRNSGGRRRSLVTRYVPIINRDFIVHLVIEHGFQLSQERRPDIEKPSS